ncbi:peptide transporter Ptr2p [[Candida] anglica]|uniref:Peptide transporter Ptr2p n=1 Tax=[Candida] anglica TaxID=148631 RepID=A0ABP0EF49_9ASCO
MSETEKLQNTSGSVNSIGEPESIASTNELYDFDDPNNYFSQYKDEHNPKGLRKPTTDETGSLRRVLEHAPKVAYLLCLVELAERGSYYGVTGSLNNFLQRPLPPGGKATGAPPANSELQAGALGLGLKTSSAVTTSLTFIAYVAPLYGGFVADAQLGKFKTIWIGVFISFISHILFIIAAIPSVISGGNALAPTVLAVITLAVGTGFIKPNLLPLLMDQYPFEQDVVKVLPSGEKVIVDRQKSIQRMSMVFYWSINIGAFFSLATSYSARRVGFYLAFLAPGILFMLLPIVLWYLESRVKKQDPKGSVLVNAWRIFRVTFSSGWISRWRKKTLWEYARPGNVVERMASSEKVPKFPVSWTDQWVLDVRQTLYSCSIFAWYPIFLLCDTGIGSIQNSQAGTMTTKGVPNDLFSNFNPLTIIVLMPILDYVFYPALRKYRIEFRPVWRVALGFGLAALSQVIGAILQWRIYKTSPCGYNATNCSYDGIVSPISAWAQVVLYILQASGECFAMTTGYELAYIRAPPNLKGLVMAIFLFMSAISSAISLAVSGALSDPNLIWPFAAMGIAGALAVVGILIKYRTLHVVMEEERKLRDGYVKNEELNRGNVYTVGGTEEENLEAVTSIKSTVGK